MAGATTTDAKLIGRVSAQPAPACRRHAYSCDAARPCRRATALTVSPPTTLSATIDAFCSALHDRRSPDPVKISRRRAGSGIGVTTVSDIAPTPRSTNTRRLTQIAASAEDAVRTPLTIHRRSPRFC